MKKIREVNGALDRWCQLALRQPPLVEQLVLIVVECLQEAGYAVLIEDHLKQEYTSIRKTYALIA